MHRGAHAHEFGARVVLDGSITLVFGEDRVTYRPGDSCSVPAGTMHEEIQGRRRALRLRTAVGSDSRLTGLRSGPSPYPTNYEIVAVSD